MTIKSYSFSHFNGAGEVIPPANATRHEAEQREQDRKREIKNETLEMALDQIDFGVLKDIIREIAEHCGIKPSDANLLGRKDIFNATKGLVAMGPADGAYYEPRNAIYLDGNKLVQAARELEVPISAYVLLALCHELAHSASRNENRVQFPNAFYSVFHEALKKIHPKSAAKFFLQHIHHKSGFGDYQQPVDPGEPVDPKHSFFTAFNEGVTEKLAFQIFREYCKRVGGIKCEVQEFLIRHRMKWKAGEAHCVELVDAVIDSINKKTGVAKLMVWQGIVHGFMTGENFADTKIKKLFDEMFSSGFLAEMRQAKNLYQTEELIKILIRIKDIPIKRLPPSLIPCPRNANLACGVRFLSIKFFKKTNV